MSCVSGAWHNLPLLSAAPPSKGAIILMDPRVQLFRLPSRTRPFKVPNDARVAAIGDKQARVCIYIRPHRTAPHSQLTSMVSRHQPNPSPGPPRKMPGNVPLHLGKTPRLGSSRRGRSWATGSGTTRTGQDVVRDRRQAAAPVVGSDADRGPRGLVSWG